MSETGYNVITPEKGVPIKAWTKGVASGGRGAPVSRQRRAAPVHFQVGSPAMPDVHWGIGATVGSVIPTKGAIIPAAVGVDIGCGMMAVQTDLTAGDLPDNLKGIRTAIEKAVPHGRTNHGGRGDRGAWGEIPARNLEVWGTLKPRYDAILAKHSKLDRGNHANHLGTLGTGNHFIEVCLDEAGVVWLMLHSGSRGVGNRMGSYFIEIARKDMERMFIQLPDRDLAYFRTARSISLRLRRGRRVGAGFRPLESSADDEADRGRRTRLRARFRRSWPSGRRSTATTTTWPASRITAKTFW